MVISPDRGFFLFQLQVSLFSRIVIDSLSTRCRVGLELVIVLAFAVVIAIAVVHVFAFAVVQVFDVVLDTVLVKKLSLLLSFVWEHQIFFVYSLYKRKKTYYLYCRTDLELALSRT